MTWEEIPQAGLRPMLTAPAWCGAQGHPDCPPSLPWLLPATSGELCAPVQGPNSSLGASDHAPTPQKQEAAVGLQEGQMPRGNHPSRGSCL